MLSGMATMDLRMRAQADSARGLAEALTGPAALSAVI